MPRGRRRGRNGDALVLQPHCDSASAGHLPDDYPRFVATSNFYCVCDIPPGRESYTQSLACRSVPGCGTGFAIAQHKAALPSRHRVTVSVVECPNSFPQFLTHQIASLPISSSSFRANPMLTRRNNSRCSKYRSTSRSVCTSCEAVRPRSSSHARSDSMSFPLPTCPVSSRIGPSCKRMSALRHDTSR